MVTAGRVSAGRMAACMKTADRANSNRTTAMSANSDLATADQTTTGGPTAGRRMRVGDCRSSNC